MNVGQVTLTWNGPQASEYVRQLAARRVQGAAMWFAGRIKERLSVPVRSKTASGRIVSQRSLPGQYLRKDTGHLRRNIAHEFSEKDLVARVGTNVPYGLEWQVAPPTIARPWLSLALKEFQQGIINILTHGAPGSTLGGKP